jgi:MHS family shikimate/dehydroshikimate transporter-like MFS transporter
MPQRKSRATVPPLYWVVVASFIGTAIEWYDFFVYGTAAALVFSRLFFPTLDPVVGTLSSYGAFAFGAAVFGHYGDRVGRKKMLVWSLLIMGFATASIGLLPAYKQIGIWAPVILVVLRFVQGVGVGGEWGGAVLLAVEHSGGMRRGFHGSWPQMGVPAGLLLSTGAFTAMSSAVPEEAFLSWGWRVPFLISVLLVGVGLFIRLRILETPSFRKLKEAREPSRAPLVALFRERPREVLIGMGMRFAQNVLFYVYTVFVLGYGETFLGYPRSLMLRGVMLSSIVGLISIPLWSHLSDRVGRKPVYLSGAILSLLMAFPFFWIVQRGPGFVALAMVLAINVGHDMMYGPMAACLSELFDTHVRYTGASIVYHLTSVFSGGLAPLIATILLSRYGSNAVAAYIVGCCALTVVATWFAPETHRVDLDRSIPQPAA